jgi:ABC-type antimicrobial peptide transport system permease subunit
MKDKYPEYYRNESGAGVTAVLLREKMVGSVRLPLLLMVGAVLFILLIACANVANLLLARAAARQKEIALRSALGARRGRIVRQLLTESLLLSIIGGGLGLLLAVLTLRLLLAGSPLDASQAQSVHLDLRALGFTMVVAVIAGVLFGLAPA